MPRFIPLITLSCLLASSLGHAQLPPAAPPSPAELAVDHVKLIRGLDDAALKRGATLYNTLCIACHGTPEKAGSLPLSRAFWKEPFKNGGDLHGIYRTLTTGLGLMPPWTMLTPVQKYDVAHYVREHFVKRGWVTSSWTGAALRLTGRTARTRRLLARRPSRILMCRAGPIP